MNKLVSEGFLGSFPTARGSSLPVNEIFEMLLNKEADLVFDPGDVGDVGWPGTDGDLVIGKALTLVVTRRTQTL